MNVRTERTTSPAPDDKIPSNFYLISGHQPAAKPTQALLFFNNATWAIAMVRDHLRGRIAWELRQRVSSEWNWTNIIGLLAFSGAGGGELKGSRS